MCDIGLVASGHAGTGRVAALRHEAADDAVEDNAVIKAFGRQLGDPRDMIGSEIRPQLDFYVAGFEVESHFFVGHQACSFSFIESFLGRI